MLKIVDSSAISNLTVFGASREISGRHFHQTARYAMRLWVSFALNKIAAADPAKIRTSLSKVVTAYTVVVPCTSSVSRGRARDLSGVLNMAADTRTIEVDATGLPFEPRPEDIILFGNAIRHASGALVQDPAAPAVKYRITSADKATYHAHWRLEVERH